MHKFLIFTLALALGACADADSDKEGADSGALDDATNADDGGTAGDEGMGDGDGDGGGEDANGGSTAGDDSGSGDEGGASICANEYAFCGSVEIPADLVGTPRAMAVSLYDTLNPLGPPNVTVMEIDAPEVTAGQSYEIEFEPLIATGDYYVWVFLYMEGGGEWAPEPGIDYFGHSDELISFTGAAVAFAPITLAMAQE